MPTTDDQESQSGVGVLVDDHAEVDGLIRGLLAALDERQSALSFERLDLLWARLAVHIRAEHLCLFPFILGALAKRQSLSATAAPKPAHARAMMERLREDHDFFMVELAKAVRAAREQCAGSAEPTPDQFLKIKQIVLAVSDRLREHNRLEEEQVYLWPAVLLSTEERAELSARMQREIENLPPRFSSS